MSEEEFNALWENLVHRAHSPESLPFSEPERCFYAVNLLRGSVPRSGFIGYFENWRAWEIAAAHEGLRTLGLLPVLALLEKAQVTVLDGRPLPADASIIEVIPASLSEEEYERESDRIDEILSPVQDEFYKHDDEIWSALCVFADRNRLKPRG